MDKKTFKIVKERFKILPRNVQEAILSADLPRKLTEIAKKYNLRVDQAGALERELQLVMLGLEHQDSFSNNVQKEVSVSHEIAEQIVSDVNSQILLPIRESLKQMQPEQGVGKEQRQERPETPESEPFQKEGTTEPFVVPYGTSKAVPKNLPTGDISALKLGGMFKVKQEEQESKDLVNERPEAGKSKNYESDPYREPIE